MGNRGFSLIEVMIVTGLFGVLLASQTNRMQHQNETQKHNEFLQDAMALASEVRAFALSPVLCSQALTGVAFTTGESPLKITMPRDGAGAAKVENVSLTHPVYAGIDVAGNACYSGNLMLRMKGAAERMVGSVLVAVNGTGNQIVGCPISCTVP